MFCVMADSPVQEAIDFELFHFPPFPQIMDTPKHTWVVVGAYSFKCLFAFVSHDRSDLSKSCLPIVWLYLVLCGCQQHIGRVCPLEVCMERDRLRFLRSTCYGF